METPDLTNLRDDDLLHLARNPAAEFRQLAILLLVERSSLLAQHEDIAAEAGHFVLPHPLILKTIDPERTTSSIKLPEL